MNRRTFLAISLALLAGLAGCSDQAAPSATTPTGDQPLIESGAGDFPHEIRIENSLDRDASITVTVERNGTQLYQATHTVGARSDAVVAGITKLTLPEAYRHISITATDSSGSATSVDVSISDCLGNIVIYYADDGSLDSTYSVC